MQTETWRFSLVCFENWIQKQAFFYIPKGNVEEDLIKDFFIAKMNNSAIRMELLSEVRKSAQVLNFALSRERGQENQREILSSSAPKLEQSSKRSVQQHQPNHHKTKTTSANTKYIQVIVLEMRGNI